jgi:hypothetical protein
MPNRMPKSLPIFPDSRAASITPASDELITLVGPPD